jgi:hypothetical protein
MYCQNCGRGDLSEPAGPGLPFMFLIKAFLLFFGFLFVLSLLKSLSSGFVILGNMLIVLIICCLGYFFLPQPLQGLVKKMLGAIKGFIFKKDE